MESIALGIPVLGADVRGIRDLVTDPSRGTLYPVGNSAALAAAMLVAATAPSKFHPLAQGPADLADTVVNGARGGDEVDAPQGRQKGEVKSSV